jgi:hypothetical protein
VVRVSLADVVGKTSKKRVWQGSIRSSTRWRKCPAGFGHERQRMRYRGRTTAGRTNSVHFRVESTGCRVASDTRVLIS